MGKILDVPKGDETEMEGASGVGEAKCTGKGGDNIVYGSWAENSELKGLPQVSLRSVENF